MQKRERNRRNNHIEPIYIKDHKGWIFGIDKSKKSHFYCPFAQIRGSDHVNPWKDADSHHHTQSQEIFILIEGKLWILIENSPFIMPKGSILLIQPNVSHAVLGGKGKICHIVMKIPQSNEDRISDFLLNDQILKKFLPIQSDRLDFSLDKKMEYFIDLSSKDYQNIWLMGLDNPEHNIKVPYYTKEFCLAYVNLPTKQVYDQVNHSELFHYHKTSTEWYYTIMGSQTIMVNNTALEVLPGQILKIPEEIPHRNIAYSFPFEGITIRTPVYLDDKYIIKI